MKEVEKWARKTVTKSLEYHGIHTTYNCTLYAKVREKSSDAETCYNIDIHCLIEGIVRVVLEAYDGGIKMAANASGTIFMSGLGSQVFIDAVLEEAKRREI